MKEDVFIYMEKNNQIYEAIRELVCLVCYASNNLKCVSSFLGEYKLVEKEYTLYLYNRFHPAIFIKCGNDCLFLMIENESHGEYWNGPIIDSVILHVNNYKNINVEDIKIKLKNKVIDIDTIEDNIIHELKIKLPYSEYECIDDLYYNYNMSGQDELERKKYTFAETEFFDKFLNQRKFFPKMEGVFSPEIILNLIEQVYLNFGQIYIDNRIDGIIKSLSQEELLALKEKLQSQDVKKLVRKNNL